jgi:hypothetical protein
MDSSRPLCIVTVRFSGTFKARAWNRYAFSEAATFGQCHIVDQGDRTNDNDGYRCRNESVVPRVTTDTPSFLRRADPSADRKDVIKTVQRQRRQLSIFWKSCQLNEDIDTIAKQAVQQQNQVEGGDGGGKLMASDRTTQVDWIGN